VATTLRRSSWICIDCEESTVDGLCSALKPRDGGTTFCRRRQPPPAVVDASSSTVVSHVTSQYNSQSADLIAYWKVVSPTTSAANDQRQRRPTAVYNFHPHCSIEACWDLQRCRRRATTNDTDSGDFVMTVHFLALPLTTSTPFDLIGRFTRALLESNHIIVEMVAKPQPACLVVVVLLGSMAADGYAASNDDDATTTIDAAANIGNGQNLLFVGCGFHTRRRVVAVRNIALWQGRYCFPSSWWHTGLDAAGI
jgi:hypothetical protein